MQGASGETFSNWGPTFSVSFEITMKNFTFEETRSIITVADAGAADDTYMYMPGVEVTPQGDTYGDLAFWCYINDNKDFYIDYTIFKDRTYKVRLIQEKIQGKTFFQVKFI